MSGSNCIRYIDDILICNTVNNCWNQIKRSNCLQNLVQWSFQFGTKSSVPCVSALYWNYGRTRLDPKVTPTLTIGWFSWRRPVQSTCASEIENGQELDRTRVRQRRRLPPPKQPWQSHYSLQQYNTSPFLSLFGVCWINLFVYKYSERCNTDMSNVYFSM